MFEKYWAIENILDFDIQHKGTDQWKKQRFLPKLFHTERIGTFAKTSK